MNLFNIKKSFEMKKEKGWPEIYFLVDLHGTIIPSGRSSDDKVDEHLFYQHAKEVLQFLCNRQDIFMILWTSTPNDRLNEVIKWLESHEIHFDFINENPDAKNTSRSDFSKKPYFNVVLDDRGGFDPTTDWLLIKNELIQIGEWFLREPEIRDFRHYTPSKPLIVENF